MFRFASWEEGLVFRSRRRQIRTLADLGHGEFSIVNRGRGSGSRALLDEGLAEAGISSAQVPGYDRIASGHLAAAFAVSSGIADCCVATSSAAHCFGLLFVPLRQEKFDLVFSRSLVRSKAGKVLLDILNRAPLRRALGQLAGYDTSETGNKLL
jgi:molybdate-binding protein